MNKEWDEKRARTLARNSLLWILERPKLIVALLLALTLSWGLICHSLQTGSVSVSHGRASDGQRLDLKDDVLWPYFEAHLYPRDFDLLVASLYRLYKRECRVELDGESVTVNCPSESDFRRKRRRLHELLNHPDFARLHKSL